MNSDSERNPQADQAARETFQMLFEISQLLNTGLDAETLSICIQLCEMGVRPEALAFAIKELRRMSQNAVQDNPQDRPRNSSS